MNRLENFLKDVFNVLERENAHIRSILELYERSVSIKGYEPTGVGAYIDLNHEVAAISKLDPGTIVGSDGKWFINDMDCPFDVVALTNEEGVLSCVEIITYVDIEWDGEIREWRYEKLEPLSYS